MANSKRARTRTTKRRQTALSLGPCTIGLDEAGPAPDFEVSAITRPHKKMPETQDDKNDPAD